MPVTVTFVSVLAGDPGDLLVAEGRRRIDPATVTDAAGPGGRATGVAGQRIAASIPAVAASAGSVVRNGGGQQRHRSEVGDSPANPGVAGVSGVSGGVILGVLAARATGATGASLIVAERRIGQGERGPCRVVDPAAIASGTTRAAVLPRVLRSRPVPPFPGAPAPPAPATLSLTVESLMVSAPVFSIPPPLPPSPASRGDSRSSRTCRWRGLSSQPAARALAVIAAARCVTGDRNVIQVQAPRVADAAAAEPTTDVPIPTGTQASAGQPGGDGDPA